MAEIVLSATSRANLLSLQDTKLLTDRTQGRLASGLKLASALDDAVAYFQAKSLVDRSTDLTARKDAINQGVSAVKTASQAAESVEKILQQLKGILIGVKTATGA